MLQYIIPAHLASVAHSLRWTWIQQLEYVAEYVRWPEALPFSSLGIRSGHIARGRGKGIGLGWLWLGLAAVLFRRG